MARIKPGTKHPTKPGLVMGTNGRYVAKSTYRRQLRTSASKTAAGKLAKRGESRPDSQRIQKVKVKVESPKQLTGSQVKGQLPKGKTRPTGRPSARQAVAAAKQVRAKQGTTTATTRVGQPAGAANRMYGAARVEQAVRRAQRSASTAGQLRRLVKGAASSPLGQAALAIEAGATVGDLMKKNLSVNTAGSGRGSGRAAFKGKKAEPKKETKPQRKSGMSNIPKAEQYVNNPNYGKKATINKPAPVKPAGTVKAATQKTTITAPQRGKPEVKKAQEKKNTTKTSAYTRVTESKATDKTVDKGMPSNPQLKSQKKTLTARQQMLQRRRAKARQVLNSRTASARERMQARIILRGA